MSGSEPSELLTDGRIGRLVGDARERAGLSQLDAAIGLGFGQSRLARIEAGQRRLLFAEAVKMARLYGASLADFDPTEREPQPRSGVRRRRIAVRAGREDRKGPPPADHG